MDQGTSEVVLREILVNYYLMSLNFCLNQKAIDGLNDSFNQQFDLKFIFNDAIDI